MRILVDTSILIAICVQNHPNHDSARQWFRKAEQEQAELFISSHSLMEAYSVLTRAPFQPKIGADQAKEMLEKNVLSRVSLISLEGDAYVKLMQKLADGQIIGGKTYDAIILACAEASNTKQVITSNFKDFLKLKQVLGYTIEVVGL